MKPGSLTLKEKIAKLSPDDKEKLKQYAESIKEMKKEINELLNKSSISEEGGNKSSGLYLNTNEE